MLHLSFTSHNYYLNRKEKVWVEKRRKVQHVYTKYQNTCTSNTAEIHSMDEVGQFSETNRIQNNNLTQWCRASRIIEENVSICCRGTNDVCLSTDNQVIRNINNKTWCDITFSKYTTTSNLCHTLQCAMVV